MTEAEKATDSIEFLEFLRHKSESGQREGTGEFSLSAEKALEKIRRFNFGGPHHHWVLALIQACHASVEKVERIEVFTTRKGVSVRFFGIPRGFLSGLETELLNFQKAQSQDMEAFRRAFWGSLEQGEILVKQGPDELRWRDKRLTLHRHEPQNTKIETFFRRARQIQASGTRVGKASKKLEPGLVRLEALINRLKKSGEQSHPVTWTLHVDNFRRNQGATTEKARVASALGLSELVKERAFCSQIPLHLEGRRLFPVPPSPGQSMYSPLHLVEGSHGKVVGKLVKQPWGEGRLRESLPLYQFEHLYEGVRFSFLCGLHQSFAGERLHLDMVSSLSKMRAVKHGVVVMEKGSSRASSISCHFELRNDELETDITGLAAQVEDVKARLLELTRGRQKESYWTRRAQHFFKGAKSAILQKPQLMDELNLLLRVSLSEKLRKALEETFPVELPEL